MRADFKYISVEQTNGIFTLRMNRASKKNALSPDMNAEILEAVSFASNSEDVRALILTGAEDSFSAGLDLELSFLQTIGEGDPRRFQKAMQPILRWYREL